MGLIAEANILLCAAESAAAEDLVQTLTQAGLAVACHPLGQPDPENLPSFQLVILEGSQGRNLALQFCRRLRHRLTDGFLPILFVATNGNPEIRLACLEHGSDAYLQRPVAREELLAQVQALLRIKARHDILNEKTAEVNRINKRLQLAYQQIDQELELARRIQQSFLPPSLPEMPRVRFAVHYQPCGRVGGDFYDVFRLDENHVGFYVADAMGHGVPASLLTIFLKNGVRAKEIIGQNYRLIPPGEVLLRLNRDLIDQGLAENPFITMVYGLLNCADGSFQFARAGHPYPLYLPANGDPQLWRVSGSLMGIFETEFPVETRQLQPGDKILFYTDGTDGVTFDNQPPGLESLQRCAVSHRGLTIQDFVTSLSKDLVRNTQQPDDFTLLGLEIV